MVVTHARVSGIADTGDPDRIQGPDWDADHVVVLADAADLVPDSVAGDAGTSGKLVDGGHSHPGPLLPQFIVQRWYGPHAVTNVRSETGVGNVPTLNRLYAVPFEIGDFREFDRIGSPVQAAAATAQLVFGVYADDGGKPGSLLLQTSALDASVAASLVDGAFDQIFSGLVWLAAVAQTAVPDVVLIWAPTAGQGGTAFYQPRIGIADPPTAIPFGGAADDNVLIAYSQDSISGALPDPWGSTLNIDGGCAIFVMLRAK